MSFKGESPIIDGSSWGDHGPQPPESEWRTPESISNPGERFFVGIARLLEI